jgi:hypothetical protein
MNRGDILMLDTEGTCGSYRGGRGMEYFPEAKACIAAFGRIGVRFVMIGSDFLEYKDDLIFRHLKGIEIRDEWLHPEWLPLQPGTDILRSFSRAGRLVDADLGKKTPFIDHWLKRNPGTGFCFVVDDMPGALPGLSIPLFAPDSETGLTYALAARMADVMGRRRAFDAAFIPARSARSRRQISPAAPAPRPTAPQ